MNNFFIIANSIKDPDLAVSKQLTEYLCVRGKKCSYAHTKEGVINPGEPFRHINPKRIPEDTEGLIVLGGDGTLLQVARDTFRRQIPMIGINLGTLGYLAEISKANMFEALEALIQDDYKIERRMMLKGTLYRENKELFSDLALNDIVIHKMAGQSMINVNNYIDGNLLNSYFADAMIVSSPTGSTGYSLSAGGPIVAPQAAVFLLTPLAPHSMINRSVIVPAENTIGIELCRNKYGYEYEAALMFDGNQVAYMKSGDQIKITRSPIDVKMLKIYESSFMDVLSQKMN